MTLRKYGSLKIWHLYIFGKKSDNTFKKWHDMHVIRKDEA